MYDYKAKIGKADNNGKHCDKKELVGGIEAVVMHKGEFYRSVSVRLWMSRSGDGASPVYASIWYHGNGKHGSGHGTAGGYGYDKRSEAVASACIRAGVSFTDNATGQNVYFGGTGEGPTDAAIRALVKALGYRGKCELIRY